MPSIWKFRLNKDATLQYLISYLRVEQTDHVPVRFFFFLFLYHLSKPELIGVNLILHVSTEIGVSKADAIGKELLIVLVDAIPCQEPLNDAC